MDLLTELKVKGWHLTLQGLKTIQSNGKNDVRDIINAALDYDFREIAEGALRSLKQADCIKGPIVLQISQIRNIGAPKANEDSNVAPRLLCVELSDGQTTIKALELERVPNLDLNVPPGTKVCFPSERIQLLGGGFIILRPAEMKILGGHVPALVEKWELARTMQLYVKSGRRASGSSAPPPWVPFGKNINEILESSGLPKEKTFKSLQMATEKDKDTKENEEFKTMRNEAIAEATKAGGKKIFGGGGQHIMDHNVKKILEKGYSEEEAKQALRFTNNNLERALYNLKRNKETKHVNQSNSTRAPSSRHAGSRDGTGIASSGGFGNKRGVGSKDDVIPLKPAGNVSLFDFLTDKLPANSTASDVNKTSNQYIKSSEKPSSQMNSAGGQEHRSTSASQTQQQTTRSSNQYQPPSASYRNGRAGSVSDSSNQNTNNTNYDRRESNSNRNSTRGGRSGGSFRNNIRNGNVGRTSNLRSGDQKTENSTHSEEWRNNNNNNINNNGKNSNERSSRGRNQQDGNLRSNQRDHQGQYQGNNYNSNYSRSASDSAFSSGKPSTASDSANRNESERNFKNESARYPRGHRDHQQKRQQNYNSMQQPQQQAQQQQQSQQQPQQNQQQMQQGQLQQTQPPNQYSTSSSQNPNTSTTSVSSQQNKYYGTKTTTTNKSNSSVNMNSANLLNNYNVNTGNAAAAAQIAAAAAAVAVRSPGNFAYDPSKIIGFQTKEANDYAMNLLKSQGKTLASPIIAATLQQSQGQQQQQQQQQQQAFQQNQQVSNATQPQPPPPQYQQAGPPQHFQAPANQQAAAMPPPTYVLQGPPPQARPPPQQFGIVTSGAAWPWKIGDLCMAKYWDDGQYYEAEITGISDRTCVVFFVGYGNHEEVLKSDCLPITDANHQPINAYTQAPTALAAAAAMSQQAHFQAAPAAAPSYIQRNSSQRYRHSDRQVYVPPPKRDN